MVRYKTLAFVLVLSMFVAIGPSAASQGSPGGTDPVEGPDYGNGRVSALRAHPCRRQV